MTRARSGRRSSRRTRTPAAPCWAGRRSPRRPAGYRGVERRWTDLARNGRLAHHYTSAAAGQHGADGAPRSPACRAHRADAGLGFGADPDAARRAAPASRPRRSRTAGAYALGWAQLPARTASGRRRACAPPAASGVPRLGAGARRQRGQAAPRCVRCLADDAVAWGAPRTPSPSGPYHLVWSRDLYEIATALIADGDRAGADRALTSCSARSRRPTVRSRRTRRSTARRSGPACNSTRSPTRSCSPTNCTASTMPTGRTSRRPRTSSCLQAGRAIPRRGPRRSAGRTRTATPPPRSPARSPGWCARPRSRSATVTPRRRSVTWPTADTWRAHLKGWTATSNGPYSSKPYFLRLTKDGKPEPRHDLLDR